MRSDPVARPTDLDRLSTWRRFRQSVTDADIHPYQSVLSVPSQPRPTVWAAYNSTGHSLGADSDACDPGRHPIPLVVLARLVHGLEQLQHNIITSMQKHQKAPDCLHWCGGGGGARINHRSMARCRREARRAMKGMRI